MDEDLKKYRSQLLDTMHFLNESYDKILITLSGGALGLSIAFLKDIVSLEDIVHGKLLLFSWAAFILSLAAVLGRIMFGLEANRMAVKQVDEGTIYDRKPGGAYSMITRILYIVSAVSLLTGLTFIAFFSFLNIGK